MSCFIVSDSCINNILSFVYKNRDNFYFSSLLSDYELNYFDEFEKLGRDFLLLNHQAFFCRYGDKINNQDLKQIQDYIFTSVEVSNYQALKSMECLRYQLSESDKIENSDLYKLLDKLIDRTKSFIIDNIEEYKKANWS